MNHWHITQATHGCAKVRAAHIGQISTVTDFGTKQMPVETGPYATKWSAVIRTTIITATIEGHFAQWNRAATEVAHA